MKRIFGFVIAGVVGLGAGVPIGWFLRKKIAEVQFVETTEEEQEAAMRANGDEHLIPVNKEDIQRPKDLQAAVDGLFAKPDVPENLQEATAKEIQNEKDREAGIRQMDTQKVQYFKQWREKAEAYDTRTTELPEDVTQLPKDAQDFVDGLTSEEEEDDHFGDGRPEIEDASKEDWEHWEHKDDGAYDCVKIFWFDEDDVVSDDDGEEIENPEKFLGFDVEKRFTGDEEVRYVYNHRQHAIFKLIRRHTSFSRKRGMEEYGNDYDGDDDTADYLRSRN